MQYLGPTLFWLGVIPCVAAVLLPGLLLQESEPGFLVRAVVFLVAVPLSTAVWSLSDRLRRAADSSRAEHPGLTTQDIVRINQLVRGEVRLMAFRAWFDSEDGDRQRLILDALAIFAQENGGIADRFVKAALARCQTELTVGMAGQFERLKRGRFAPREEATARKFQTVKEWLLGRPYERTLQDWVHEATPAERGEALPFFVYLFGLAEEEGRCRDMRQCNHWWHRDLLDPNVLARILGESQSSSPASEMTVDFSREARFALKVAFQRAALGGEKEFNVADLLFGLVTTKEASGFLDGAGIFALPLFEFLGGEPELFEALNRQAKYLSDGDASHLGPEIPDIAEGYLGPHLGSSPSLWMSEDLNSVVTEARAVALKTRGAEVTPLHLLLSIARQETDPSNGKVNWRSTRVGLEELLDL